MGKILLPNENELNISSNKDMYSVVRKYMTELYSTLDLGLFTMNGKSGIYNFQTDEIMVQPKYDDISLYKDSIFLADDNGSISLLDIDGEDLYKFVCDIFGANSPTGFQDYSITRKKTDNLILQDFSGFWGVFNVDLKHEIVPYLFQSIEEVESNNCYLAYDDEQVGLLSLDGKKIMSSKHEEDVFAYLLSQKIFNVFDKKKETVKKR